MNPEGMGLEDVVKVAGLLDTRLCAAIKALDALGVQERQCDWCGAPFWLTMRRDGSLRKPGRTAYCSMTCADAAWAARKAEQAQRAAERRVEFSEPGTVRRLRAVRRSRGIKQVDLARAARIDTASLCRLERGDMRPYPRWQARIAAAIGWKGDPAELFEPDEGEQAGDAQPQGKG